MADFKFNVGDLVVARTGIEQAKVYCSAGREFSGPVIYMVVERHAQECPGGIQRHYTLGSGSQGGKANEIELIAAADYDNAAMLKIWRDAVEVNAKAERDRWRREMEEESAESKP